MKNYTTEQKIADYLGITLVAGMFDDVMEGVEAYIDKYTGRNFVADTDASDRLFDGRGSRKLRIDDCIDIISVEIGNEDFGGTFTAITDFVKLPNNELPKTEIITTDGTAFILGIGNHKVNAKWGYSVAVPADITQACTMISAGVYSFGQSGGGQGVKSEKIGDYSVSYKEQNANQVITQVQGILDRYKKMML